MRTLIAENRIKECSRQRENMNRSEEVENQWIFSGKLKQSRVIRAQSLVISWGVFQAGEGEIDIMLKSLDSISLATSDFIFQQKFGLMRAELQEWLRYWTLRKGFLSSSIIDHWGQIILVLWESVLHIVGHLAASMASTSQIPGASPSSFVTTKVFTAETV